MIPWVQGQLIDVAVDAAARYAKGGPEVPHGLGVRSTWWMLLFDSCFDYYVLLHFMYIYIYISYIAYIHICICIHVYIYIYTHICISMPCKMGSCEGVIPSSRGRGHRGGALWADLGPFSCLAPRTELGPTCLTWHILCHMFFFFLQTSWMVSYILKWVVPWMGRWNQFI